MSNVESFKKDTTIHLPTWLEKRYDILWNAFHSNEFSMEEAVKILEQENKDEKRMIPVYLSELKKTGRLKVRLDPKDGRKRVYLLTSHEEIIETILTIDQKKLSRSDIDAILKKAADLIRTRVDYKFILILLFLKRISDKWEQEYYLAVEEALEDGLSEEEAAEEAKNEAFHDFDLPEEALWDNIRKDVSTLPEKLSNAFKEIAERNPPLKNVLDNVDFIQFTTSRENFEILRQLIELFSEKKLHHVSPDILGDAYEWILQYFAPTKAKEGEVYTPREVIKLLVEILDPKPGEKVYDPASASNGMLIMSYKYVKENHGAKEAERVSLFGQEVNPKTLAFGRMNLYIHDIKNHIIDYGDTLLYPKFREGNGVKQFDVVIANPPWNQDGYAEDTLKRGELWKTRFRYGHVPKQSADWAWIQHMLASSTKESGRVGIVIDNGCLFRGGKERTIRKKIVEEDFINAIILLPEKLFYNTGAPGAILILTKNKPDSRKGKILFINASEQFGKHPNVRKLNILDKDNVEAIAKAFINFGGSDGFARAVPIEEIVENDYNLNVTLYVYPKEEIEDIDISKEWQDLRSLESEISTVENVIEGYLEELRQFNQRGG